MLILCAVLGFAAALIFGGRIKNIECCRIRLIFLPFVAAALLFAASLLCGSVIPRQPCFGLMLSASYAASLIFALANFRLVLFALPAAVGTAMNYAVIACNGFYMPVSSAAAGDISFAQSAMYRPLTGETRLPFLADIIYWPFPNGFASIGDIFVAAGAIFLIFYLLRPRFFKIKQ